MRRALLAVALALAGCSILEPQPDSSRFFTLGAVADGAGAPGAVAVGLGPVRVPGYLDRPELATRVASSELVFSPTDRWAEPLATNLRRVIAQNLGAILGTEEVAVFPWPAGTHVDWTASVDVLRFERTPDGQVEVAARWVVREGVGGRPRLARETRHTEHADGNGTVAAVEAWNKAVAALSADIAAGITSLGPRPEP